MEKFDDIYNKQEKVKEESPEKKIIKFDSEKWSEQDKRAFEVISIIKGIEGPENDREREDSVEAYIAGGAARDYLRGKKPNDIDICTSAQPNDIEKRFADAPNYSCYYVGKSKEHKIINVRYKDENTEYIFEVATFRKDVYLPEEISEKIKSMESTGFSKRLIEFDEDYEDLKNEFEQDEDSDYSFAGKEDVGTFFGKDYIFSETGKEGVFKIKTEDEELEVAFFKKNNNKGGEEGVAEERMQKHIAGRHPDFVKTKGVSAKEDAKRRDFTMNGVLYDPAKKEMVDYVGGYEDIKNEIIRFTGKPNERIEQDKIRILRFFRFRGVLGLKADEKSLEAVRTWLADEENQKEFRDMFELNQRIKPELEKILKSGKRAEILQDLMDEGVLDLMLPQISKMKGVEQPKEFHQEGDVWEHTKECLKNIPPEENFKDENEYLEFVWAALLHDTGKPGSKEISMENGAERIRFNNHEKISVEISKQVLLIEKEAKKFRGEGLNENGERLMGLNFDHKFASDIIWLVSNHMHHLDFSKMTKIKQNRLMENMSFENLVKLWKADVLGSRPVRTENIDEAVKIYEEYKKNRKKEKSEKKKDVINPDELMEILKSEGIEMKGGLVNFKKYSFSRAIPILIDYLNNLILEEKISDKDMAEEKMRSMIGKERMFDNIAILVDGDHKIEKLKQEILDVEGKNKSKQIKKIEAQICQRANDIFSEYIEKRSAL